MVANDGIANDFNEWYCERSTHTRDTNDYARESNGTKDLTIG
jgi:hypothetical protein